MPKNERTHFSFDGKVAILYSDEIPINDCILIAQVLDDMTFDAIKKLSKSIIKISNGFSIDSALETVLKEEISHDQNQTR